MVLGFRTSTSLVEATVWPSSILVEINFFLQISGSDEPCLTW